MNKNDFVSNERLYLDKDGNVVGDKDPGKLTLLVSEGGTLPMEEAEKYGLVKEKGQGEREALEAEDAEAEAAADEEEETAPIKRTPAKKTAKKK